MDRGFGGGLWPLTLNQELTDVKCRDMVLLSKEITNELRKRGRNIGRVKC